MEPNPRRAVQNLNTFHAMAAPDLCMLEEKHKKQSNPTIIQLPKIVFFTLMVEHDNSCHGQNQENHQFPIRRKHTRDSGAPMPEAKKEKEKALLACKIGIFLGHTQVST